MVPNELFNSARESHKFTRKSRNLSKETNTYGSKASIGSGMGLIGIY